MGVKRLTEGRQVAGRLLQYALGHVAEHLGEALLYGAFHDVILDQQRLSVRLLVDVDDVRLDGVRANRRDVAVGALVRVVVDVRHHVTTDADALARDVRTVLALVLLDELALEHR